MIPERIWFSEKRRGGGSALHAVLKGLSLPYGVIVAVRNRLYDEGRLPIRRLPAKVVCVGNLSVGGSGKTPFVRFLAGRLRGSGKSTAVISRGYRGRGRMGLVVVSDGRTLHASPRTAGDEPVWLACRAKVPVVAGKDRFAAGMLAWRRFHPEFLLMDDGFQHRRLARDLDIVLLDAERDVRREALLPAGPLREPVGALKRAHILVLTHWRENAVCRSHRRFLESAFKKPVFRAVHEPTALCRGEVRLDPAALSGRRVAGFSGLGRNDRFLRTLVDLGAKVVRFERFRDHPDYGTGDVRRLRSLAEESRAEYLVTTEKDRVSLEPYVDSDFEPWVLHVEIRLVDDERMFWKTWPWWSDAAGTADRGKDGFRRGWNAHASG